MAEFSGPRLLRRGAGAWSGTSSASGRRRASPTRTGQGDLSFVYTLGHGDTKHVVLLPSSIEECFEFGWRALDLADQLQTPVFVLSDLDLGMNNWMGRPFAYPDRPCSAARCSAPRRSSSAASPATSTSTATASPTARCRATTHPRAAYFARGTGHNAHAATASAPTTGSRTPSASPASSRRPAATSPTASSRAPRGRPRRGHRLRHHALRHRGGARPLADDGCHFSSLRLRALPITDAVRASSRRTSASSSSR
jgi:2-oxoglutarate/2-oxoacid ferredoxin oxidoreductase subunit alpha